MLRQQLSLLDSVTADTGNSMQMLASPVTHPAGWACDLQSCGSAAVRKTSTSYMEHQSRELGMKLTTHGKDIDTAATVASMTHSSFVHADTPDIPTTICSHLLSWPPVDSPVFSARPTSSAPSFATQSSRCLAPFEIIRQLVAILL